jgi:hypothetical protein
MGRELTRSLVAAEGRKWEPIGLNTREWWRIVANVRRVPRRSKLRDPSPDHSRLLMRLLIFGVPSQVIPTPTCFHSTCVGCGCAEIALAGQAVGRGLQKWAAKHTRPMWIRHIDAVNAMRPPHGRKNTSIVAITTFDIARPQQIPSMDEIGGGREIVVSNAGRCFLGPFVRAATVSRR